MTSPLATLFAVAVLLAAVVLALGAGRGAGGYRRGPSRITKRPPSPTPLKSRETTPTTED